MLSNLEIFLSQRRIHMKIFRKLDNSLVTNCLTNSKRQDIAPTAAPTLPKTCLTVNHLASSTVRIRLLRSLLSYPLGMPSSQTQRLSTLLSSCMLSLMLAYKPMVMNNWKSLTKLICLVLTYWMPSKRTNNHHNKSIQVCSSISLLLLSYLLKVSTNLPKKSTILNQNIASTNRCQCSCPWIPRRPGSLNRQQGGCSKTSSSLTVDGNAPSARTTTLKAVKTVTGARNQSALKMSRVSPYT
jgi:hypothetical protein